MQMYIVKNFGKVPESEWNKYCDLSFHKYFFTWDNYVDSAGSTDQQLPSVLFTWFYRKFLKGDCIQPIKVVRAVHDFVFSQISID